jgi:HTH-type transcriptional regulator / antitoxin HigA
MKIAPIISVSVIKNETSYKAALKRTQEIFHAKKGTPEAEELEILSILIEEYEDKRFIIPESDPMDIIKFVMDQNELKQSDLIGILGDKTYVSKVLNRKRPLTLEMIRKFSKTFHIRADLLIKEYELER